MNPEPPFAGPVVIQMDNPCVHCGYNLRGLRLDGLCPECGAPVQHSVHGHLLRFADPAWLAKLRLGTRLKLWGIGLGFVFGVAMSVLAIALNPTVVGMVALPVTLLASVLNLCAAFLITTQEPRTALTEDPITWRRVIRVCAVAGFAGGLFPHIAPGLASEHTILFMAIAILQLSSLVGLIGELVYFRGFALRIPDGKLAKSTRTLMWAVVISIGCGALGAGVLVLTGAASVFLTGAVPAAPSTTVSVLVTGSACIVTLVSLVLLLWYINLLVRYSRAFQQALQAAEVLSAPCGSPSA